MHGYLAVQMALAALDRLEVRGRDSAGVHVYVRGHGLDLDRPPLRAEVAVGMERLSFMFSTILRATPRRGWAPSGRGTSALARFPGAAGRSPGAAAAGAAASGDVSAAAGGL